MRRGEQLSARARMQRLTFLAATVGSAAVLRAIDPTQLALGVSCRAITGVPCIFCGMTRALHFLFRGDVARALYFNWLAIPLLAFGVTASVVLTFEIVCGRRLLRVNPMHFSRRAIALACCSLLALWSFQVWLAIANDKRELLNPRGPLYALLVRQ